MQRNKPWNSAPFCSHREVALTPGEGVTAPPPVTQSAGIYVLSPGLSGGHTMVGKDTGLALKEMMIQGEDEQTNL